MNVWDIEAHYWFTIDFKIDCKHFCLKIINYRGCDVSFNTTKISGISGQRIHSSRDKLKVCYRTIRRKRVLNCVYWELSLIQVCGKTISYQNKSIYGITRDRERRLPANHMKLVFRCCKNLSKCISCLDFELHHSHSVLYIYLNKIETYIRNYCKCCSNSVYVYNINKCVCEKTIFV